MLQIYSDTSILSLSRPILRPILSPWIKSTFAGSLRCALCRHLGVLCGRLEMGPPRVVMGPWGPIPWGCYPNGGYPNGYPNSLHPCIWFPLIVASQNGGFISWKILLHGVI